MSETINHESLRKRCIVYVDGYNWYHAIFKHRPDWKWLNIQSFFEELRLDDEVVEIKMFTAIVDEDDPNSGPRERHVTYVKALKSLSKVKVILGKFQNREVTCRADCRKKYSVPEEKKTDVNIAVNILSDVVKSRCESVVVVSGDSDAQPPIQWVRENYPTIKINVYVPALKNEQAERRLDFYKQARIPCKFLPLEIIAKHQLPNLVRCGGGHLAVRPASWPAAAPV